MLYLDNSATTKPYPQVIQVMGDAMENYFGNPSSLHRKGIEAERLLNKSREVVAQSLGVEREEIIFTAGGTEGDNLAIKGVAFNYQSRGKHIITTKIEHPAVRESCQQLEKHGFKITYLDVDRWGFINLQDLEKNINQETILVSIIHANNEVGTIQPLSEIGQLLRQHPKIIYHVDGVQSFGKVPLFLKNWSIDLATISGHKIHGPKGVGALYVRKGISLSPLFTGGGQENNVRSGTENVASIAGFAKACQITREIFVEDRENMIKLKKYLTDNLKNKFPQVVIIGPEGEGASPYILNISVPGLKGEVLVHGLEDENIYVSTGSACSSKKDIMSPVLEAMGLERDTMLGSIRLSFTYNTQAEQINEFLKGFTKVLKKIGQ